MYTVVWDSNESVGGIRNVAAVENLMQRRSPGSTLSSTVHLHEGFETHYIVAKDGSVVGAVVTFHPEKSGTTVS